MVHIIRNINALLKKNGGTELTEKAKGPIRAAAVAYSKQHFENKMTELSKESRVAYDYLLQIELVSLALVTNQCRRAWFLVNI